jgi:hypothetical protein
VARTDYDKRWVSTKVTCIQNVVRRMLAIKFFNSKKIMLNDAVLYIQKQFRSWISQRSLGERLFERELKYRADVFAMLTAEEEYAQEKLGKLVGRLIDGDMKSRVEFSVTLLHKKYAKIDSIEVEIINLTYEKDTLSPRGVVQGWLPELRYVYIYTYIYIYIYI